MLLFWKVGIYPDTSRLHNSPQELSFSRPKNSKRPAVHTIQVTSTTSLSCALDLGDKKVFSLTKESRFISQTKRLWKLEKSGGATRRAHVGLWPIARKSRGRGQMYFENRITVEKCYEMTFPDAFGVRDIFDSSSSTSVNLVIADID